MNETTSLTEWKRLADNRLDEIKRLQSYIQSLDGKHVGARTDGNTFLDEGCIVAADILNPLDKCRL